MTTRLKPLALPQRCASRATEFHGPLDGPAWRGWFSDGRCPNFVNIHRPRRLFKQEPGHMCWSRVCDFCYDTCMAYEDDWGEGWPQGEGGRFLPSQECEVA